MKRLHEGNEGSITNHSNSSEEECNKKRKLQEGHPQIGVLEYIGHGAEHIIWEIWSEWLADRVRIKYDGSIGGYIEDYISHYDWRSITASLKGKSWLKARLTAKPNYGIIVDCIDFFRWSELTNYYNDKFRVRPKFYTPSKAVQELLEPSDPICDYQIIAQEATHGDFVTFVPLNLDINQPYVPNTKYSYK